MNSSRTFRIWRWLCVAGIGAIVLSGGAMLFLMASGSDASGFGGNAVAASATDSPANPPAPPGARCRHCGWIESMRETSGGFADSPIYEYTVRMADGSSRVFEEPGAHWRLRERLIFIEGAPPHN